MRLASTWKNAALAVETNQIPLLRGVRDDIDLSCFIQQPHHPLPPLPSRVPGFLLGSARLDHYPQRHNLTANRNLLFYPVSSAAEYSQLSFRDNSRTRPLDPFPEMAL